MSTQAIPHYTAEQYIEIEIAAESRHEYLNGEIYAMAGGTLNHARIVRRVIARLDEQLPGGSRCEAFANDVRLFIAAHNIFTYPDIVVACSPIRLHDRFPDTIADATLAIEVLSPSTRNYDHGDKFRFYRSLPSFSEYLLLAQDTVRAEHHVRQPDGSWIFREFTSLTDRIELPSIGCHLLLEAIYDQIDFTD